MRVLLRPVVLVVALVAAGATALWAGDPPWAGTWKLNPEKSDFGETTVTYEKMAGGEMKLTSEGQSYTFKADGNEYPTPWGVSAAWKAVDDSTWKVTNKVDEKVVATATLKLAADGKTLTIDARNMNASGEASESTAVYQRVSGESGLAGKWKTKNVEISSPGTMKISPSGPDGLTLTFVEQEGTCTARFDGNDHPATGPVWPAGWTCAIARSGTNGFDVTWKRGGKVMFKDSLTLSADGKTLTDVGATPGTEEKITAVYDRQ